MSMFHKVRAPIFARMAPPRSVPQRYEILGMLKAGMAPTKIAKVSGVHLSTVYRIKSRAKTRNNNMENAKGQGRKASKVIRRNAEILRKRVGRNPKRSLRAMAKEMNMGRTSMRNLAAKIGLKSVNMLVVHDIMPGQQERRLNRSKLLLE